MTDELLLVLSDAEGTVTVAEGAALARFGLRPGEAVGRAVSEVWASWPTLGAGMRRALGGVASQELMQVNGRELVLRFEPRAARPAPGGALLIGQASSERAPRAHEHELERSLSLLRATLESSADGLMVVDRQGAVVVYNQRLLAMWGLSPATMRASNLQQLMAQVHDQLEEASRESCARHVQAMDRDPAAESFDALHFIDGRFFERYSRPQRVGDEIVGRVWSYRDVTERERLLRLAQEALAARDEFLSILAHEIRGPVTALHLATEVLMTHPDEPTLSRMLDITGREGRRIAGFVDEVVELAQTQRGELHLLLSPVDLVAVTREIVARRSAEIVRSRSRLSIDAPPSIVGNWDRQRLGQIVSKLLSNAVKFGEGRPISISLSSDGKMARVLVRDHGVGVPPEAEQRIFAPFERAVSARNYGGLGIGLYLARMLVERLGGSLLLEPTPGGGASFVVELPLARPA